MPAAQDTSNKATGGDLGFQGRGALEKPFENAIFSARPGTFTTARTSLSSSACWSSWVKRLSGFSVGCRNPPLRAFISIPSTGMMAIFPLPRFWRGCASTS